MARVTGPDFVALQVRDLESSGRFYEERLIDPDVYVVTVHDG
jgi:hypothetical protein